MDEGTLIQRAAAGDRHAFGILVRAHQEGVYRCVRGLVRDEEAARDLTQETFLRSFRALPGFRGEAAFGTWLRTIAANAAKSHLRREGARVVVPLDDALPAEAPPPDAGLEAEADRDALRRALERLPPRQRQVVHLRVYRELPYAEIARRVGSSEDAAKVNFHHAIKRLRRLLAEAGAASAPDA
jgi:RNA polymerase sigma-70 factor (ECF subfamily)